MKTYGVVQIHVFLTSTLFGGEWSASSADRFSPCRSANVGNNSRPELYVEMEIWNEKIFKL
jgi:hypothetical protein